MAACQFIRQNKTKSDARPPDAMLTYTPDRACLSYQDVHCPPAVLCHRATHGKHFTPAQQPLVRRHLT